MSLFSERLRRLSSINVDDVLNDVQFKNSEITDKSRRLTILRGGRNLRIRRGMFLTDKEKEERFKKFMEFEYPE